MINTDIYIEYQAYGHMHMVLTHKLQEYSNIKRPSVGTVVKFLGEAAQQTRQDYPRTEVIAGSELSSLIEAKLNYDLEQKYLSYVSKAANDYLTALRQLVRPTRRQIDNALQAVLNNVTKNLLQVY